MQSLFRHYSLDDRERAEKIFTDNSLDLAAYGLLSEAQSAIQECGTSEQLDMRLSFLLTTRMPNRGNQRAKIIEDDGANGYIGNTERALEGRNA